MDWSIQEIARLAGTTSRTLRHYDRIGLLRPSRVAANGYRHYDQQALMRLQRILLLRELGLGLAEIAAVLERQHDPVPALRRHLKALEEQRDQLDARIRAVRTTIDRTMKGEPLMAEEILEGFDNSKYEAEVVERWGREAWDDSNRKWARLGPEDQARHGEEHEAIAAGFAAALAGGLAPGAPEVQALARRHHTWVSLFWTPNREAYENLGIMYDEDPRFTATYDRHGKGTARFIREAIAVFARENLQ